MVFRRRQFYRKISEWGFEKNIKDKEMRTLVQDLNQRRNDGEGPTVELKGKQVDPVKMYRWQKRHGGMKDVARPFLSNHFLGKSSRLSCNPFSRSNGGSVAASSSKISNTTYGCESLMETSESFTVDPPTEATEALRVTDDSKNGGLNNWDLVDVPGSPLLSRLFEALKIECENTIPSLDLTSSSPASAFLSTPEAESDMSSAAEWVDFSTGAGSNDLVKYSQEVFQNSGTFSIDSSPGLAELSFSEWSFREWDFSRGQPPKMNISHIFGLSPFLALPQTSRHGTSDRRQFSSYARSRDFQVEETKCKSRLRKLKRTLGAENPRTLLAMNDLGYIYSEQDKFKPAERLYRQTAISYQRTLGLKHRDTLYAYLDVVSTLCNRGERLRASKIHQRIHDTIIEVASQDDHLALRSNSIKTRMLYSFGKLDEADRLVRQTFQILMYTRGPRHQTTLHDMKTLARTLKRCGKLAESEKLLRINVHLYHELEGPFSRKFLNSLQDLANVWLTQERYDECRNLSMVLAERLGTSVGPEHEDTLFSLYSVAECERMRGNLSESERQLRSILAKRGKHPDAYLYLRQLSRALGDMGRHSEATALLERSHKGSTESLGAGDRETLLCCRALGDNYEKLGRYEDAVALLQQNIDDARSPEENPTKDLLRTISQLATLLRRTDCYIEAVPLYEECFQGFVEIYGLSPTNLWTLDAIDGLSICYEALGRFGDAFALYQQSIDQIRRLEDEDHPALKEISGWMTALRENLAASTEEVDESEDRMETSGVDEALIEEGIANTDERLAECDVSLAEEDWMGELFDFGLVENHPSKIIDSHVDAQVNET
jgi:tetratricopeptide (TPR) repeat protein